MKKQFMMIAVALLTAGVLTTGCSNDEVAIETPTEQTVKGDILFTATVEAKGGTTRSVNDNGVTAWVVDEKIAVYYEKNGGTYGTATANVDAVNGGVATISASLSNAKNGGTVKFVYPATLHDGTGGIDTSILGGQNGTIDDISANFDAATASETLQTNGTTCGTSSTITFTNQVLIGKFIPKYGGTEIDGITTLIISDGTNMYAVTPESPATAFGTTGIYVAMLPVSNKKVTITAYTALATYIFKKNVTLEVGKLYTSLEIPCYPQTVNLSSVTTTSDGVETVGTTPTLRLRDGQLVTGSLIRTDDAHKVKVTILDGATVTLNSATIDGKAENGTNTPWAGITCEGDATIELTGTNTVKNFDNGYPAIFVPTGKTLTIGGSGSLTASNTLYNTNGVGAAIGGGYEIDCGNIVITGGTITANGGSSAAGIGGGRNASCGNITISGGNITATGGSCGAGIGSGSISGSNVTCGDITISGTARVTATGGNNGAGIGSGYTDQYRSNSCGNISISGTCIVIATGGDYAAGIGTGQKATCGNVSITGGTIAAQGGRLAAGIGCGAGNNSKKSACGNITIKTIDGYEADFTSVTAIRGQGGFHPIGHSSDDIENNSCGTITFGDNDEVYIEGDNDLCYYTDCGGLNFESQTNVPPGEDNNNHSYDDNTWVLSK